MSFSYRKGLPHYGSEHGGGYIFDCRCVPNPGRDPQFAPLSGLDAPVKEYLEKSTEALSFFAHCSALVLQTVRHYQEREFTSLTIGFGCTGGRHRSVYFSERLRALLESLPGVQVTVTHRELVGADFE